MRLPRLGKILPLAAFAAPALVAAGCTGPTYPVTGRVAFPDGTPLKEGMVVLEGTVNGKLVSARGRLDPDGRFDLGVSRHGEGVIPGHYRVEILPRSLTPNEAAIMPPFIETKYSSFDTSGLTVNIEPGKNSYDFTVTKVANWKKPAPAPKED